MGKHYIPKLGEASDEAKALPFASLLPTDRVELLKLRIYIRARCILDLDFRARIAQMCAKDVVFFVQIFVCFHETREGQVGRLGTFPVILDLDQQDILAWLQLNSGKRDLLIEKSRGIGMSYLLCAFCLWLWLFKGESIDIALVSKDKTSLDNGRPSSLMGKLHVIFKALPKWMQIGKDDKSILVYTSTNSKFDNKKNGNAILGFVPTDEKLRSGRFYMVVLDEAAFFPNDVQRWIASAHGTSPSIIWLSTHNGRANIFYRLSIDKRMTRISSWWWDNTRCARGLYKVEHDAVTIIDKEYYKLVKDYKFCYNYQGRLRSPFVDAAFDRSGAETASVLEELYGMAAIDTRKLFRDRVLNKAKEMCVPPIYRGNIDKNGDFEEDLDGEFKLWVVPKTTSSMYVIGGDPSLGTSNGAYAGIVAWDSRTGAQVLSGRLVECPPTEFANRLVQVAKFLAGPRGFGVCKIVHEATGIGVSVTTELKRLRYPNLWEDGDKIGLHNKDNGENWLIEIMRAIEDGEAFIKDAQMVEEFDLFEYDLDDELGYAGTDGHGDVAMAGAVGWWAARERRGSFVRQQQKAYNSRLLPPDQEPKWLAMQKQKDLWSAQFN